MTAIPVTDGQRLRVDDVLLAGETPDGPALVSIEAIVLDEAGLTVIGPRPGVERLVPWSDISGFGGCAPASLPSGAGASALVIDVRGRSLRFLLPDATVAASTIIGLDREINAHLSRPSEATAAPAPVAPQAVEAPIADASPTPHLPPTQALHPLGAAPAAAAPAAAAPAAAAPATGVPGVPVPVPPRAVTLPPSTVAAPLVSAPAPPPPVGAPAAAAPPAPAAARVADEIGDVGEAAAPGFTDELAVVPAPKRDRRKRGVRGARSAQVAKPLLAADEFAFVSDPELPRGGPPPGAVIEVTRHHRTRRRVLVLTAVLVVVAAGAIGSYYSRNGSLPLLGSGAPPVNGARDLRLATPTVIQPSDLPGWAVLHVDGTEPFALGAASSVTADQASASASNELALCLRVSPATLSAATGVAGAPVPERTAFASSRVYADSVGDAANSATDVMDAASVEGADAKVFADGSLFSTCYQPYVQAMLPYLSSQWGSSQGFDTATVAPVAVPTPPRGERAFGFQITLFGHSGDSGTTATLTDVAVFAGRFQATMSMYSNLVFPVVTQASLIGSTESRVAAAAAG